MIRITHTINGIDGHTVIEVETDTMREALNELKTAGVALAGQPDEGLTTARQDEDGKGTPGWRRFF